MIGTIIDSLLLSVAGIGVLKPLGSFSLYYNLVFVSIKTHSSPFNSDYTHTRNMSASALRSPSFLMGLANLFGLGGSTYVLRSYHIYNLEEHEARMDELEGTLRGHIGLIEEALDRLEGQGGEKGKKT